MPEVRKPRIKRPITVSIVSVITFILGLAGTFAAIIFAVGTAFLPRSVNIPTVYLYAALFWFVVGPLLILAGYNLWKMKKWAGQLAAIVYLYDLIASPFISGIDIGYIFTGIIDIVLLVLITLSWKHIGEETKMFKPLSHLPQEKNKEVKTE